MILSAFLEGLCQKEKEWMFLGILVKIFTGTIFENLQNKADICRL